MFKIGQKILFIQDVPWVFAADKKIFTEDDYEKNTFEDRLLPIGEIAIVASVNEDADWRGYGAYVHFLNGAGTTYVTSDNIKDGKCKILPPDYNKFWTKFNEK